MASIELYGQEFEHLPLCFVFYSSLFVYHLKAVFILTRNKYLKIRLHLLLGIGNKYYFKNVWYVLENLKNNNKQDYHNTCFIMKSSH